jgi:hypothetical protein
VTRFGTPTVLALAVLLANACGGGGGGGPTAPPPPPTPPPLGIAFNPAGSPGANCVFLAAADTSNTTSPLVVEVRANEFSDVYGVSFDLQFPSDLLRWERGDVTEGSFLGADGAVETELLIDRRPAGNLVVGITRLGEVEGADGSGLLLTLEFQNRAVAGSGDFSFSDNDLVDSSGEIKEGSQWLAGSIESRI